MEKLQFGDIVLLNFPFSSFAESKKRPAFVIKDTEDGDVIVCHITSKIYSETYDYFIQRWENLGLKLPSVIRLHKIATLEKKLVFKLINSVNIYEAKDILSILSKVLNVNNN